MFRWCVRIVIGLAVTAVLVVGAGPWLLYGIGLGKVDGRPRRASQAIVASEDAEALWRKLRIQAPVQLDPVSPYSYLWGSTRPSTRIAWTIAKSYNTEHLTDHRAWHLSGAALTIWLTRNWTTGELVAKAVELDKARERPGLP
jgi:hypothetical protein